jgi:hypothetical protein
MSVKLIGFNGESHGTVSIVHDFYLMQDEIAGNFNLADRVYTKFIYGSHLISCQEEWDTCMKVSPETLTVVICSDEFGWALRQAEYGVILPNYSSNRVIVTKSVSHDGLSLCYASHALRSDREIVRIAVRQNGKALRFAVDQLKSDRSIILDAGSQYHLALRFASIAIREESEREAFRHLYNL